MDMEWKPIETAPSDGTLVLIWASDTVFTAWYDKHKGWKSSGLSYLSPTHWMPLPAPPSL